MFYNPEGVVEASGMDPASILGFVQENYLDFIEERAMEDVASASAYLSDAGKIALPSAAIAFRFIACGHMHPLTF